MENEIILYQSDERPFHLEVKMDRETVWLNRQQLALLFKRDVKTIGKHINNALSEELIGLSVVANFATTAADGKVYNTAHYNLDVIISVGYRVKSKQGTLFRIWASRVLKDHLLKGFSFNSRLSNLENSVAGIRQKVEGLEL